MIDWETLLLVVIPLGALGIMTLLGYPENIIESTNSTVLLD